MTRTGQLAARAGTVPSRRGVAAVLSMMFLILFGSLAAAMAIATKGNITTASTHLRVLRAQGAAETGLHVAVSRLRASASRFVVAESDIDSAFGWNLWSGNLGGIGTYTILPSKTGRVDLPTPSGLADALGDLHSLDQDIVAEAGPSTPTMANAIAGVSAEFAGTNWLFTPAVAIEPRIAAGSIPPVCYQVTYAPLANGTDVRVIVTGFDFSLMREGFNDAGTRALMPVKRTVMQDVRLAKRVNNAIISPARLMIGKNVRIEGDLGTTFTQTATNDGDPMLIRSDFYGLATLLDTKLNHFFAGVKTKDVDADNRLRASHPIEATGIPSNAQDLDGNGQADNAYTDATGDGYVDDFDIFINHFDTNGDNRLAVDWSGVTPEFAQDTALAVLIDSSSPDRNRNGFYGFTDTNRNGRWDTGEVFSDFDTDATGSENPNRDQVLGYMDGYIDYRDKYYKVSGSLNFRVGSAQWTTDQGDIADRLRGGVNPAEGVSARRFGLDANDLPTFNAATFVDSRNSLQSAADGQSFSQQVASNLGIAAASLPTYNEVQAPGPTVKRYRRVDADANFDGLPDNSATAYWEKMPFASPSYSDIYYRPVYENMVFKDVQIPAGNNGLFINCTFAGVTYVRSTTDNDHILWSEYGKMVLDTTTGLPKTAFPRTIYGDSGAETSYPTMLPSTAVPPAQMILMSNTPLDKADLPANIAAVTTGFDLLPAPLVIAGKRITDTKPISNNIRFHGCLIVGSIVSDSPTTYTQLRNKIQFTGSTRILPRHPDLPDDAGLNPDPLDAELIETSSMMLPQYSVDVGNFNSPVTQDVQLSGAIIAGVLDVRGNASINGSLILTYDPQMGQGPLRDALGNPVGNPSNFNGTFGYFGPDEGDSESVDPNTLPLVGGQRRVGFDTNGDGLVDDGATSGTPIYFNGYGRIDLRYNPDAKLPNGVMLPMQIVPLTSTYREGKIQ
jgi:hypothetical protein